MYKDRNRDVSVGKNFFVVVFIARTMWMSCNPLTAIFFVLNKYYLSQQAKKKEYVSVVISWCYHNSDSVNVPFALIQSCIKSGCEC